MAEKLPELAKKMSGYDNAYEWMITLKNGSFLTEKKADEIIRRCNSYEQQQVVIRELVRQGQAAYDYLCTSSKFDWDNLIKAPLKQAITKAEELIKGAILMSETNKTTEILKELRRCEGLQVVFNSFNKFTLQEIEDACDRLEQKQDVIVFMKTACEKVNQCFKCRYGYFSTEGCSDVADAELPCAGYEEDYDGKSELIEAITKAEELIKES